jgi:hypothetical protein
MTSHKFHQRFIRSTTFVLLTISSTKIQYPWHNNLDHSSLNALGMTSPSTKWKASTISAKKSRLTREKVLTHKAFWRTRLYANMLANASKIASSIYSDLPIEWRQFWMFRSFTGEAFSMLEGGSTAQEAYDYLWQTYVEYWIIYQHTTGIRLKAGRSVRKGFRRGKTCKTRLKHRTENPKCRRYRMLLSKHHWKSSYDHTADILERERKRIAREEKFKWLEEYRAKQKLLAEQQVNEDSVPDRPPLPGKRLPEIIQTIQPVAA